MKQLFFKERKSPYYKEIKAAIAELDSEIYSFLRSNHEILDKTACHLHKSGGKRLRPAFVFLGGQFGNYNREKLMPLAMSVEITHMATLVHDDVVDSAVLRRNSPTVKAIWGNKASIYTGNFLLAKALKLASSFEDNELSKLLSATALAMCRGEIAQLNDKGKIDKNPEIYFLRIEQKTALLLSASCKLGAYISGASEDISKTLQEFGKYLGMAFQITDDVLDYSPHAEKFGKVLGGDIKEGVVTLPLLYAAESPNNREILTEIFAKKTRSDADIKKVLKLVSNSNGIKSAENMAKEYTIKAKNCLLNLPSGEIRDSFMEIADFVLTRKV